MFHNQKKKTMQLILLIIALTVVILGCSKQDNAQSGNAQSNKEKAITVSWMRDLGTSNPHAYYPSQLFSQSMLFEPLVTYGEGGEIKPFLAESWEISEDGKQYTFKLRKDVKYSDGSTFNAASVKKNFDAILLNKKTHSWIGIAKVLEQTDVIDEYSVKITLSQPYYPTLQDLSTVRPYRFLADAGFPDDGDTLKSIKAPIGTGPWILKEYKQDEFAVFVKNPNYWGEKPKLDKVTVKIIPDAETRVLAFEKGDLDMIFGEGAINLDAFTGLRDSGKYTTDLSKPVGTRNLVLNTMNDKLADNRVRQALHLGFNKQALVDGITSGVESKADQVLSKDYPYVKTNFEAHNYNVDKANAYLEEAGWKLPTGKTVREKDGQMLELNLMYDTTDRIQKVMGEALQAEWAAIGVKLNFVGLELKEQYKRFSQGEFDLNFWFNSGVPYDPHTLVNAIGEPGFGISEAHTNISMKAQLDKQIKSVLSVTDEKERQQLYDTILQTVQEQSVIIPLSYIKQTVVYHKHLKDVQFPTSRWDHPFNSIDVTK
ncbi:nickel ABC transporter substrate-binding protein [Paenibacillus sp. L3-i20]|uniref:nickel ABC transporter substrate-binding protein n=1 Tax=Paenibacillus sp. L3-i20 TaxID=2905833 RepID=UPI001EDEEA06|nr:nickel ABC transporter substrate-binding protein [Paenibacillus sp. L3-i20]GKU78918.1 nickel ABC transporter, nickel/metallophore periplasmic binding protein [Paenibacillus sp. L3-i20]